MRLFTFAQRYCLGHEVISVAIILVVISPAIDGGNFTRPVAVHRVNRRCPFECIRAPWILCRHLAALPDRCKEVYDKEKLRKEYNDSADGYKAVERDKLPEALPGTIVIIATRHTGDTFIVHGPEYHVSPDERYPEVDVAKRIVHESTVHLWIPMINARKHSKECRYTHHDVEVGYYEVGVVQVNIDSRVAEEQTRETAGDKQRYKTERKHHTRREAQVAAPDGRNPVKHLNGRRNRDKQRQQHENRTEERTHARHEHMVRPYKEGEHRNADERDNHREITKDGLPAVDR